MQDDLNVFGVQRNIVFVCLHALYTYTRRRIYIIFPLFILQNILQHAYYYTIRYYIRREENKKGRKYGGDRRLLYFPIVVIITPLLG